MVFRLGVDFGTSNTVAVLAWPDGRVRPLSFDGQQQLPSAVCALPGEPLLVGRAAVHAARQAPEAFEPYPKQRIDDGSVLLGDRTVSVVELISTVLGSVAAEAGRVTGSASIGDVVLTHPAGWGGPRQRVLLDAARAVGWDRARLSPEPVAAAAAFVESHGARLPVGANALVYDLGAGTFDATVVRRTTDGFHVLATQGRSDAGGLDIDQAIVGHLGTVFADRDPERWRQFTAPRTAEERRARWAFLDDVRIAKELLSTRPSVLIDNAYLGVDAPLGREQLDRLTRPVLDRTVVAVRQTLRTAGLTADDLAAVFLVGGSTRMPLVATVLHRALGRPPSLLEQPETVVAEGSLRTPADGGVVPVPTASLKPAPVPAGEVLPGRPDLGTGQQREAGFWTRPVIARIAFVIVALTVAAVAGYALRPEQPRDRSETPTRYPVVTGAAPVAVLRQGAGSYDVAFSPDGQTLASTDDRSVRLWDTGTHKPVGAAFTGHTGWVFGVAFSPDGRILATASADKTARLWNVATRRPIGPPLTGHEAWVRHAVFTRDGRTLATASDDGTVKLWNVATGRPIGLGLVGHTDAVMGLSLSPDGRTIATGSDDYTVRLWTIADQRFLPPPLIGHTAWVRAVAFNPSGPTLASGGMDGTVLLWNPETHKPLGPSLGGHTGPIYGLAFSRNGQTLASAGQDRTIRLWDATNGRSTGPALTGHTAWVRSVAFSPDERLLATASDDHTVRLWRLAYQT